MEVNMKIETAHELYSIDTFRQCFILNRGDTELGSFFGDHQDATEDKSCAREL